MAAFMKFISGLFHPLLLATYMLVILYLRAPHLIGPVSIDSIPTLIFAAFLTTCLIPIFTIGILKLTSKVSNLELTNREERIMPFISITLFYTATTYIFITQFKIGIVLSVTLVTITALIFTLLIITNWFKISIHAAANWSTVGILTYLLVTEGDVFFYPLIYWVLFAGLVSTSRLSLGYHRPSEIWIGSIYGFLFSFGGLMIFA